MDATILSYHSPSRRFCFTVTDTGTQPFRYVFRAVVHPQPELPGFIEVVHRHRFAGEPPTALSAAWDFARGIEKPAQLNTDELVHIGQFLENHGT